MLWHERMGYIGEKGLRAMHNNGMFEGFPECGLEAYFCEHCIYGKQSQERFPSRVTRENGILELLHSDMFGPITVPSLGWSMYYVSFIDDFSRNTWIYFLRKKSKVFEKFKEFKYLVENQIDKKIKVLRTENGGEFCGKEYDHFCKQCGTTHQNTMPYTPQKNGVSKRMDRMLMVKARSMFRGVGMAQEFWVEEVDTARYLVIMYPSSTLVNMTPHEVCSGNNPSISHLKHLDMMHLCMFPRKRGARWTRRQ
jgi:hypothetical protein